MKSKWFLILFVSMIVLTSCGDSGNFFQEANKTADAPTSEEDVVTSALAQVQDGMDRPGLAAIDAPRKVVKSGHMSFKTDAPEEARGKLLLLATSNGGFIAQDELRQIKGREIHNVTISVPVTRYDSVVELAREIGGEIENQSISMNDVTSEFVDVQQRLATRKKMEERVESFITKANNMEELLNLEDVLMRRRVDTESAEARYNSLRESTAYSTLSIHFYKEIPIETPGFWDNMGTSFSLGYDGLKEFIVALTILWPLWLISIIVLMGYKIYRRSILKSKATA